MSVVVAEEQIKVTRFIVHTSRSSTHPFYVNGVLSDETIIELEDFIGKSLQKDRYIGIFELVQQFCKDNNIPQCQLITY